MRRANSRLVAPQSASVGQYFRVAAVDANGVVTAVEAVDAPAGGGGSDGGLSAIAKSALMAVVENIAVFTVDNPQKLIDNLRNALYDVPVASISAVYTQTSTVYASDSLDVLRGGLVVTATYTDGSAAIRTDYALSGMLTAGVSVITVTLDGKTTTFEVQVSASRIPAMGITLSNQSVSIDDGNPVQLTATVEPVYSTDTVVWTSSEEAVATVAPDGTVTPVASGSCIITATAGDVSAACAVTVAMPLTGYNYGNPALNYVQSDPTTLGKTDEELKNKWYSGFYNAWGSALGFNNAVFLHPFTNGTYYIRYVNRVVKPGYMNFYAFGNSDIVANPTATLGMVGDTYKDATLTSYSTFDNCELNANDAIGRPNIGTWDYVNDSGNTSGEGFVGLYKITVPKDVYVFLCSSQHLSAKDWPGISEKYPLNDWYTIFEDDPSGNILQIAKEA